MHGLHVAHYESLFSSGAGASDRCMESRRFDSGQVIREKKKKKKKKKKNRQKWVLYKIAMRGFNSLVFKIKRFSMSVESNYAKPIVTYSHAFSRAWHGRHVFAFGLGFTTLKWKLLYWGSTEIMSHFWPIMIVHVHVCMYDLPRHYTGCYYVLFIITLTYLVGIFIRKSHRCHSIAIL